MFGVIHTDLEAFHLQRNYTWRSQVKSVPASLVQEWARTFSWGSSEASAVSLKGVSSFQVDLGQIPLFMRHTF